MDAGLRARRQQLGQRPRSEHELKDNRKKILIAAAAVLGFGVLANAVFDPDFDFDSDRAATIPSRPEATGAVEIDAEQLYQAYREDEKAADRRFEGREMVVTGEFLRIVPDGYGSLDLRLKTSNPEIPVGIDVTQLALEEAKQLRPGQKVTVSCQGMGGSGNELWVRDCAIQNVEQGSAAPPGPQSPPAPTAPAPPAADPAASAGNGA